MAAYILYAEINKQDGTIFDVDPEPYNNEFARQQLYGEPAALVAAINLIG